MSARFQTVTALIPAIPPYNFALTAGYATYFRGRYGTDIFENGAFRRLLDINGRLMLASLSARSPIAAPQLSIELTGTDVDRAAIGPATAQVAKILGTGQDLTPFYAMARQDKALTRLIGGLYGLHVPQTATVFEALILAILGQQISASVAHQLRTALIRAYGPSLTLAGTVYQAFPHPSSLATAGIEEFRTLGLSLRKAEYVSAIARAITDGKLDLESLFAKPESEVVTLLSSLRGVGPWTVEWLLVRALGRKDGFPASDLALLRMMGTLLGREAPVTPEEARAYSSRWSPFRSYVTTYLFAAARSGHLELLQPDDSPSDTEENESRPN
jgi:DNA-3-methyladenine glycosylase II